MTRTVFHSNHTELVLSANIDSWLRGYANIAVLDDEIELEEAYFETLGMGLRLTFKGGRFRSGIGYQNEIHAHAWIFLTTALCTMPCSERHTFRTASRLNG